MNEPLKPRVDFAQPLDVEQEPSFKAAHAFSEPEAEKFTPVLNSLDEVEDEGQAEAVIEAALHPKRSIWRRMVQVGLGLFGVSVVAQGVQWTHNAFVTQDWIALGGGIAGGLIIAAGVGSVATEWRRLWRLRQRAEERDEARDLMHSHGMGKGRAFCKSWRARLGLITGIRHYNAGMPRFMKRKTTAK